MRIAESLRNQMTGTPYRVCAALAAVLFFAGTFALGRAQQSAAPKDDVKAAPGDVGIARRAARVRAQVVQNIVDEAEAAALDGELDKATALMREALLIDPGNTVVAERLAQMKQMPTLRPTCA